jgi:hypothetical protein
VSVRRWIEDPEGRRVELTEERWEHICESHPELATLEALVVDAVREPDLRLPGRSANERWHLIEFVGPSRWIQVVVAYEHGRGWIVTAFPRRSRPGPP